MGWCFSKRNLSWTLLPHIFVSSQHFAKSGKVQESLDIRTYSKQVLNKTYAWLLPKDGLNTLGGGFLGSSCVVTVPLLSNWRNTAVSTRKDIDIVGGELGVTADSTQKEINPITGQSHLLSSRLRSMHMRADSEFQANRRISGRCLVMRAHLHIFKRF